MLNRFERAGVEIEYSFKERSQNTTFLAIDIALFITHSLKLDI